MDHLKPLARMLAIAATTACLALTAVTGAAQTPSGPPIKIGSTLALTGPLSRPPRRCTSSSATSTSSS